MTAHLISDAQDNPPDEANAFGTALPRQPIYDRRTWDDHVRFETPDAREEVSRLRVAPEAFDAMSDLERFENRSKRRQFSLQLPPILSSRYRRIYDEMLRVANTNLEMSPGIRMGCVLTGPPTIGKTTLLVWFGRRYERRRRAIHRAQFGTDEYVMGQAPWRFTPVVYVSLDGTKTLKALLQNIAAFLLVPRHDGLDELQLKTRIAEYANRCGVSLLLIDDIHYLDRRFVGAGPLNNVLKKFMGSIPATFMYAGIDCDSVGLFSEWRSGGGVRVASQTNHRFGKIELSPFNSSKADLEEIANVIATFDENCVLLRHEPGDLVRLTPYIMKRTSGYMGAIATLIKHGAANAIMGGAERYSTDLLDKVKLDHAAETSHTPLPATAAVGEASGPQAERKRGAKREKGA